jgi:hypothetical protein
VVLLTECKIPSLKLVVEFFSNTSVEEEIFVYLDKLYKTHHDVDLVNETYQKHIKIQYDKSV